MRGKELPEDAYTTWQVAKEYLPKDKLMKYERMFKDFDFANIGLITIEAISTAANNMGHSVASDIVLDIFRSVTGNDSSKAVTQVDFEEFIAIMSVVVTDCVTEDEMSRVFEAFDKNKDGYISREELKDLLSRLGDDITDEDLNDMIREADHDEDDRVSYQEFVRVLTNSNEKYNEGQRDIATLSALDSSPTIGCETKLEHWITSLLHSEDSPPIVKNSNSKLTFIRTPTFLRRNKKRHPEKIVLVPKPPRRMSSSCPSLTELLSPLQKQGKRGKGARRRFTDGSGTGFVRTAFFRMTKKSQGNVKPSECEILSRFTPDSFNPILIKCSSVQ